MVMACVATEVISFWCVSVTSRSVTINMICYDQFVGKNVYEIVALLPLPSTNCDPILQQLPLYQLA